MTTCAVDPRLLASYDVVYPRAMESGWVLLAIVLAFVGAGIAYALARRGRALGAVVWCSSLALLGIVLLLVASAASGWDGLAYLLVDLLFVGPAFVGSLIGLAIGFGVARRERARATPRDET